MGRPVQLRCEGHVFAGLAELTNASGYFSIVAAAMVALNLYIIYRLLCGTSVPALSTFVLGGGVLVSQAAFWLGTGYYLASPTVTGFTMFALATQSMMAPFGLWFVTLVFEEGERPAQRAAWPVALGLLLLANELLMSLAFAALVPGSLPANLGSWASYGQAVLTAISSGWYFWPMGVTMLVLVRWSGLASEDRAALYALSASAFVAPWAFEVPIVGATAMAIIMAAAIALLWQGLRSPGATASALRLRAFVALAFFAMSGAWVVSYLWLPSSWGFAPFAGAMLAVMTAELIFLLSTMFRQEGAVPVGGVPAMAPAPSGIVAGHPSERPQAPPTSVEPNS